MYTIRRVFHYLQLFFYSDLGILMLILVVPHHVFVFDSASEENEGIRGGCRVGNPPLHYRNPIRKFLSRKCEGNSEYDTRIMHNHEKFLENSTKFTGHHEHYWSGGLT